MLLNVFFHSSCLFFNLHVVVLDDGLGLLLRAAFSVGSPLHYGPIPRTIIRGLTVYHLINVALFQKGVDALLKDLVLGIVVFLIELHGFLTISIEFTE